MAVTLFQDKGNCCGCGACMNACSHKAISMVEDEYGFLYPQVDPTLCVECGICRQACGYQNSPLKRKPLMCYAAVAKDEALLCASSSGGVFPVISRKIMKSGGVVYGAAMPLEDAGFMPKHLGISQEKDLPLLQGSKYVQSDTSFTYRQVKADLQLGKPVLYSGTPCQIAGLLRYLGGEYDNLLTMEVICHGVPNAKMFRGFIAELEGNDQRKITGFTFRSKGKNGSKMLCVEYSGTADEQKKQLMGAEEYAYTYYFQQSCISRESCYSCPFAMGERVADLTIGDYWGFYQEHPEISPRSFAGGGAGVSCVLANSGKGLRAIESCAAEFALIETRFSKICRHNEQLRKPCKLCGERENLMRIYREMGYSGLESHFQRTCKKERLLLRIAGMIPSGIRRNIRRAAGWIQNRNGS